MTFVKFSLLKSFAVSQEVTTFTFVNEEKNNKLQSLLIKLITKLKHIVMKSVELTKNEREVLEAIVDNAKKVGDSGIEFILQDVSVIVKRNIKSVTATAGSLAKKGFIVCSNNETYFDGEVTSAGLLEIKKEEEARVWYENDRDNNQSFGMSDFWFGCKDKEGYSGINAYTSIPTKDWNELSSVFKSNLISLLSDKIKEIKFEAPAMDYRIVRMNEIKAVKLANISAKHRPDIKRARAVIDYVMSNWDNFEPLNKLYSDSISDPEVMKAGAEAEVIEFALNRSLELVRKDKKEPKESKPKLKEAKSKPQDVPSNKVEQKAEKRAKIERKVGDLHPTQPWVWTEYQSGKFDWRIRPDMKKQGERTDKKTTTVPPKQTSKDRAGEAKANAKDKKNPIQKAKQMNIDQFLEFSKTAQPSGKLSQPQSIALKMLKQGYRLSEDQKFFVKEGEKNVVTDISVLTALLARYRVDYLPKGLTIKK